MLDKIFDPKSFSNNLCDCLASKGNSGNPFMILLPPPNVTGSLHIGHSLCYTLQDILARYKRMRGFDVLFQPGLDHAGIVTQLLVEKQLYSSGVAKGSLTRDQLLSAIWKWKDESGGKIIEQMRTLGISCDFDRMRFTMDEKSQTAVRKMFVKLHENGLLYRDLRMVNWDPLLKSAISDLEVSEKEVAGNLWYIKYAIADSDEFLVVATTRPETLFGDTAIAVNPNDDRYQAIIGKCAIVPFVNRRIPIIADEYADPSKGSGVVKITPAHDFNDFEVGARHKLPSIDVMDDEGKLNENTPADFVGLDRFEARKKVISMLEESEMIEKIEPIKHVLPFGDRSGVVLEPKITHQWFVNAEKLSVAAIESVKNGSIKFIPKHWENLYFEWLNNIRPWCVSRQIWWGHRIPAWHGEDGHIFVAECEEEAIAQAKKHYGNDNPALRQDDDVLDTWFSSAMWPFVTLGWPEESEELHKYLSNMIVVTGFDIIFFWISRMIMFGIFATKKVPFDKVYIHGLVRDEKGNKMSKSRGNVIDPLDLCDSYGADAVRYTLAFMSSPGRDLKMNKQTTEIGRNFLTKLWNVVRFLQMNNCVVNENFDPNNVKSSFSKWIIAEIKQTVNNMEQSIDNYRFDDAANEIYKSVWSTFCDWYIEFIKPILQSGSPTESADPEQSGLAKEIKDTTAWAALQYVKLLYPIAPFIASKLHDEMICKQSLINWPAVSHISDFTDSAKEIDFLKNAIIAVRSMRQMLQIAHSEKVEVYIEASNDTINNYFLSSADILNRFGIKLVDKKGNQAVSTVIADAALHISIDGKIDAQSEKMRLQKEIAKLETVKTSSIARLNNADFMSKASDDIVQENKNRVSEITDKISKLNEILQCLG